MVGGSDLAGFRPAGCGEALMKALRPITIVGGGLAGLSLGIGLRREGVETHVLEAGHYPRHRVCGEFITGLAPSTIDALGIEPAFAGAGSLGTATFFLDGRAIGRYDLPAPARALSRYALDARLAGLFMEAGGQLSTDHRVEPQARGDGWVRTTGRKRTGASPWMGLKLHARRLSTVDALEMHLGDRAYIGLSRVEDGWINVCGLFHRRPGVRSDRQNALSSWMRACGLGDLAARIEAAEIRPGSQTAVAGFGFDRQICAPDEVELGDANVMIPPFTGNGMAMAFDSAALALKPLVAWARGCSSWHDTARVIRAYSDREFKCRLACAASLHPFLLKPVGQHCLGAAARAGLLPVGALYRLLH